MAKYKGAGHPRFYELLSEIAELHSNKNQDYATSDNPLINFTREGNVLEEYGIITKGNPELKYAMTLMSKQIDGVYKMVGNGDSGKAESVADKFRDIAVYSLICMILCEECK